MKLEIVLIKAQVPRRDLWRATLTTSTNRQFSWCVVNFPDIESQAKAYEESEKGEAT